MWRKPDDIAANVRYCTLLQPASREQRNLDLRHADAHDSRANDSMKV